MHDCAALANPPLSDSIVWFKTNTRGIKYSPAAAKMPQPVREYLRRVGLDAWAVHFQTHLPANCTSVAKVRATTAVDMRRLGTKANMRLDSTTIQQVLNALTKK